jgi:hypothetical protein
VSSAAGAVEVGVSSLATQIVHLEVTIDASPVGAADFTFAVAGPSAADSTWSVTPETELTADGVESFEVIITVLDASAEHLPTPGAEVTFGVPSAVVPVESGPYIAGADGVVRVHLASTVAGVYTIAALVGGEPVGSETKQIAFKPGPIDYGPGHTVLEGPGEISAPANGADTLTVAAWVLDTHLNPVPGGVVTFSVPEGASTARQGQRLDGPASVDVRVDETGRAALDYVSEVAGTYEVLAWARTAQGTSEPITAGSPARLTFSAVIRDDPDPPMPSARVSPSNGLWIAGSGNSPGDVITVLDGSGRQLCRTATSEDLSWFCPLQPPLIEGDRVAVTLTTADGVSSLTWRIGLPRATANTPSVTRGGRVEIAVKGFQPEEPVAFQPEASAAISPRTQETSTLTTVAADAEGSATLTWAVSPAADYGTYQVVVTGEVSGSVIVRFTVEATNKPGNGSPQSADPAPTQRLPTTGSDWAWRLTWVSLGLGAAGCVTVFLAKRRVRTAN